MRVSSAMIATALLAGFVHADAQSVLKDASASVSSAATEASSSGASIASDAATAVESATGALKPTFTVSI